MNVLLEYVITVAIFLIIGIGGIFLYKMLSKIRKFNKIFDNIDEWWKDIKAYFRITDFSFHSIMDELLSMYYKMVDILLIIAGGLRKIMGGIVWYVHQIVNTISKGWR